jgi:hypothetical protein
MSKKEKVAVKVENKIVPFETILRCKLTAKELIARGNEMAEASAEVVTLEDTIASVKEEYQAKIDARQARVNELSETIRAKSESRLIKCERGFCYASGRVLEARLDTKEIFNIREMRDDERQMEMAI